MGACRCRPSAEARRDDYAARNGDSYEFMSPWDRCITRGIPGSMFPAGYNNAYQIIQTPGYVDHPLRDDPRRAHHSRSTAARARRACRRGWASRAAAGKATRSSSRPTNYHNKGWITTSAASARIKGIPHSDKLHVSNDSSASSTDVISYSATIEDPEIYTKPWTISFPLTADPDYRIFDTRATRATTRSRTSCGARGRSRRPRRSHRFSRRHGNATTAASCPRQ